MADAIGTSDIPICAISKPETLTSLDVILHFMLGTHALTASQGDPSLSGPGATALPEF